MKYLSGDKLHFASSAVEIIQVDFPHSVGEINYLGNQNLRKYQDNHFQQNNNFYQGRRFKVVTSNR